MAKEDFVKNLSELNDIGIVRICTDFYSVPNKGLFVKSPSTADHSWSLKLYPESNSFCDFANGQTGGDIIRFISYVQKCDNWTALQLLCDRYNLPMSREKTTKDELRKKIRLQKHKEEIKETRRQEFLTALFNCIYDLKAQEKQLTDMLDQLELFRDDWVTVRNWLSEVTGKLDTLCIASCRYRRLKPNMLLGLPSDRPGWLLDALNILKDEGMFEATDDELNEIEAQAEFEAHRKAGSDGRCAIGW